jgi:xanthine dehydrogenase accessory factor
MADPPAAATRADEDHAALALAAQGASLCTVVAIDGSYSRRLGAQLAVGRDGRAVGGLSDACLDRQLAADIATLDRPEVRRYGRGSPLVDFRLPCGGGLDILLDPAPSAAACRAALDALADRRPATLALPANPHLAARRYIPRARIRAFGDRAEVSALADVGRAAGLEVEAIGSDTLTLGRPSGLPPADAFTAVVVMFHDHEWELALLAEALAGEAFYIGVMGGLTTRLAREARFSEAQIASADMARIRSPMGLIAACKSPATLAVSVIAQIVADYERLRPAA